MDDRAGARPGAPPLVETAPAKVNLALHVLGRRPDGYHALSSLVAFAGVADTVTLAPGEGLSLSVTGPTGDAAGPTGDNLILRAARRLAVATPGLRLGAFALVKRLPVAAGIGGGSSDAAAALRLLARANGMPSDHPSLLDVARRTGADVPVCLDPRARMMEGAGEAVGAALGWPGLCAVLVNPGVAVETPRVFAALGLAPGQDYAPAGAPPASVLAPSTASPAALIAALAGLRNDLEAPAIAVAPVIAEVLSALRALPGCLLPRMSGSGATCFGLFPNRRATVEAARSLRAARPAWWIVPTVLR